MTHHSISHLTKEDQRTMLGELLVNAITEGKVEIAKELIPKTDLHYDHCKPLRRAARQGYLELVELLIPGSDPTVLHSEALILAVSNRHFDCVKVLIPASNPKACNSRALLQAGHNGDLEMVQLLWPHSDVTVWENDEKSWKAIQPNIREWMEIQIEKERLNQTLNQASNHRFKKTL